MITRPSTPNSNEAATVTIPMHQVGDLIIVWAWRDGSTTNPTIPGGWTTITSTTDGTTCSISMGWKIATSSGETSGTWTNATSTAAAVFRGAGSVSANFSTATTGATQTWNAVTLTGKKSWLIGFVGHRSTNTTTLTTPPTGMTNLASTLGASSDVAVHCSEGVVLLNYATNNTTSGGTASGAITAIVEIKPLGNSFNNFATPTSASGGVMSITEKAR